MIAGGRRAVFDCNVLLQAVLSDSGPAFHCLELVETRQVSLLLSPYVLAEARDVLSRPKLLNKNPQITPFRVAQFMGLLTRLAILIEHVPHVIDFARDRKDEPYLDLAVAGNANYLVTRDAKHLLRFFKEDTLESLTFRQRYPTLKILDPPGFIMEVCPRRSENGQEE
jgi:putative PIN family toxin of toxin-antitoxin system